ncbi:MAG TPA: VWA domain-containing protein [Terracidiphilus sp.]|nr:VWA domain-containing protein [Terracidiphilus sp.]
MLSATRNFFTGLAALGLAVAITPARSQTQMQNQAQSQPAATQAKSTAPQAKPAATTAKPAIAADEASAISLDLVVHDKKHRPVLDLTKGDLTVTDNGVPVKLTDFHLVDGKSNEQHLLILVFDPLQGAAAKDAQRIALKVLKMVPEKGFSVAVMDFKGRLRLIQRFTNDYKDVEDAIKVATDPKDKTQAATVEAAEKNLVSVARTGADLKGVHASIKERSQAQTLLTALEDAQRIQQDRHARACLAGLMALSRAQQQITARKAILYFTTNPQMDSAANEMVKTIMGTANRAGVSIDAVDMNAFSSDGAHQMSNAMMNGQAPYSPAAQPVAGSGGMASTTPMQQEAGMPASGSGATSWGTSQDVAEATGFANRSNEWQMFHQPKGLMAELAQGTGGTYLDAQDSVKKPLERILGDMTTFYEATYVPPIKDYDGKFRTIDVKTVKSGLSVNTRTGYFALPPTADGSVQPFEEPLLKAMAAPQLPDALNFNARVIRFGNLPDGYTNSMVVDVPIAQLETKKDTQTNLYTAHAAIVAQIKDKSGTVVEQFGEDLTHRGALDALDHGETAPITLERHFIEIPGSYQLQVGVLDEMSGKMSAQRSTFDIPAQTAGPGLSDMVLVASLHPMDQDADPMDPMRYSRDKITANLSGQVPANDRDVSLFFMLHPDSSDASPAVLKMQVIHNGHAGKVTPLPMAADPHGTFPYLASFKGTVLSPGDYKVKAMLTQGGKTAVQTVAFSVAGAAAAAGAPEPAVGDVTYTAPVGMQTAPGQLAITAVTNPMPKPSPAAITSLLNDAQDRATHYTESVPNFICVQHTVRSVDSSGRGNWKQKDTITELLRYHDKVESRTTLEINGEKSNVDRASIDGALSTGELGGVLRAVFQPSAHATFDWAETDSLDGSTVQVFNYKVDSKNSLFGVTGSNGIQILAAYHGRVYIDSSTHSVRRISLIADRMPSKFPTHYTAIRVDYGYVVINDHDYLVPVNAEMSLRQGRHKAELNTMQFRDYRRFGSNAQILTVNPGVKR